MAFDILIRHRRFQSVLVSSNPGLLKLYSRSNSSATYWTGHRVLRLQTLKISRESSALHPVSGINYLPELDALIVTLFDGSFHIVQNLSSSPTFTQVSSSELIHHTDGGLNSQALSLMSRKMFELSEKGNVNKNDMNRVHGAISYDADAVFMWAYECVMLRLLGKVFAADLAQIKVVPSLRLQLQARFEAKQHTCRSPAVVCK